MGAHKLKLDSSLWEVEAGEPGAQGQPKLQSKAILGYISSGLKNQNQTTSQEVGSGTGMELKLLQNGQKTGHGGLEEDTALFI